MGVEVGRPPRRPSSPPPRPSTSPPGVSPPPPPAAQSLAQTGPCPALAGLAPLVGSQSSWVLSVRGECLLSFPSMRNEPCGGAVSAHLNGSLSLCCLSVLGLPGPASGWLGLGVQPPPAAHAAAHLPGGGPLLHQQAQAGRVAGTLEKGGEVPSGLGPSRCHSIGKPEVSFRHPLRLLPVTFGLTSHTSGDCSIPRQGGVPLVFQHLLSIRQCTRLCVCVTPALMELAF